MGTIPCGICYASRKFAQYLALAAAVAIVGGCASKPPKEGGLSSQEARVLPSSEAAAAATAAAEANDGVTTVKNRRFFGIMSPYRIVIQQGNFVSREMVSQLKPGMSREQVRFILGTPLVTDIFHADRWDYVFRLQKGNGELTTSHLTVYFEHDLMARVEGGDLPTEADYLSRLSGGASEAQKQIKQSERTDIVPPSSVAPSNAHN